MLVSHSTLDRFGMIVKADPVVQPLQSNCEVIVKP